jgi:Mg/Co/Ni transporter MgtE
MERRMIRFMLTHVGIGLVMAAVATWALIHWDVGGIGTLIARASDPLAWTLFLYGSLALTCGPLAVFLAVMARAGEDG